MASRIQVIVEAKDAASGVLRGITSQMGQLGNLVDDLTQKNISWGNVAQSATSLVIQGIQESIRATREYAIEVRDLSLASGQGAEESSRMLQVLDDFNLTANDATSAARSLTKEGLAPTIDTLAQLADQYNSLTSAQEKNEFILKNLGRSGLQWANMLSQGGKAIKEMSKNVNESLILTEENIQASEDYSVALDNWNDAVQALKVSIGNGLLPVLTNLLTNTNDAANLTRHQMMQQAFLNDALKDGTITQDEYNAKMEEFGITQKNVEKATRGATAAIQDQTEADKAAAEAAKELSRTNQGILSNMFALQSLSEGFAQGEQDRAAKLAAIEAEKIRIALQTNSLRAAGQLTWEKQNELIQRGIELEQEYAQVQADGEQAIVDAEEARKKMIYSMLEQKLAQDGITDSKDVQYLQDTAVTMGLVDRASADAAISAAKAADALFAGFSAGLPPLTTTRDVMGQIASYNGQIVRMGVILDLASTFGGGYQRYGGIGGYADGGPVRSGRPIIVGEEGPEMFIPRQSGEIIPNDRMRQEVTININGTFRIPADMDYVAQEVAKIMAR